MHSKRHEITETRLAWSAPTTYLLRTYYVPTTYLLRTYCYTYRARLDDLMNLVPLVGHAA